MADFLLPDLGEGLTEAEVVRWLVAVGDLVTVDQPVVEVETAKATVEVPVPFAGVVTELHGKVGQVIDVGKPLISVDSAMREPGVVTAADATAGDVSDSEASGNVLIGYGTPSGSAKRRGRRTRTSHLSDPGVVRATPEPDKWRVVAVISPVVRKLARDKQIDLTTIEGSGPGGLVVRRDVEAAASTTTPTPTAAGAMPRSAQAGAAAERRIPMTGVRRLMAERLSRSRREIPEATVWVDVDATGLVEARAAIGKDQVSLLGLLGRFCVLGLQRYPDLNSRVDVEAQEIVVSSRINLGFAAQTDRGLVVPVVHDAQDMTLRELSGAMAALLAKARDGKLAASDLTGGTFTVNNYGVFGVDGSAAIINHPEAAIIGMGRIIDRPWAVDGQLAVRKVSQLTISFDHRVCDGGVAGGFLRFVADCVERPAMLLADL
jgi:pyruvate dehydrogenase E2 component (dihydrolipoamide acetyltransferase)